VVIELGANLQGESVGDCDRYGKVAGGRWQVSGVKKNDALDLYLQPATCNLTPFRY
jgi:hypothetical protein